MASEEVIDSSVGWVAKHVQSYVESNGRRGHRWSGVHTLLITTRGRKTGALHRTALIYGREGDRYVVVGSNGGKRHHPNWFRNLQKTPEVHVQVGPEKFHACARSATADERPRLWGLMTSIWPEYEKYQQKTSREIPVVIIEWR
jgi:deazaflavin-dependent oxidoreductase (nitroreductase family)